MPRQWKKLCLLEKTKIQFLTLLRENGQVPYIVLSFMTLHYLYHMDMDATQSVQPDGQVVSECIPELGNTQEEADTKIFVHAKHASNDGHESIIVKSSDTDVEVLADTFRKQLLGEYTFSVVPQRHQDMLMSELLQQNWAMKFVMH